MSRQAKTPAHEVIARLREIGMLDDVRAIAARYHVTIGQLCGTVRTPTATAARHAAWAHVRTITRLSSTEIGALFGRDHTTVLSGLARARERGRHDDVDRVRALMRVI